MNIIHNLCEPQKVKNSNHTLWYYGLFLLAVCYLLVSILTISVYQLPWFDDVYYADVAWSFLTQGDFSALIDRPRNTNAFFHVPLFSVIQAGVFKLFGLGLWQVRILPLLSGLTVFLILANLVFQATRSAKYTFLFMLLFISDRAINFSLHSGRMDMLALLFVLLSILLFERTLKWRGLALSTVGALLAGLLLAAGFLTAMRVAIATIPCVLLLFLYKPERRGAFCYSLVVFGVMAALPVIGWIWYAYGGVAGAYATTTNLDQFSDHFGFLSSIIGNVFRRIYEIPKMVLFYGAITYLFFKRGELVRQNFFFCMYALITSGFIMFVLERGPYRAMFFPFVYFTIIAAVYATTNVTIKRIGQFALVGVLGLNIFLSMPRIIYLLMNWPVIQHDKVVEQIYSEIPTGSRIITDYRFYFILRERNCDILIPRYNRLDIVEYVENNFSPEYILGDTVLASQLSDRLKPIKMIGMPEVPMNSILGTFVHSEPLMRGNNYHAQLWKLE